MASAPQPQLPLFYQGLTPLSSQEHGSWKARQLDGFTFVQGAHAIPVTVDEFIQAQRSYPIVFASGPDPVPLALLGLNEGVNMFVNDEGKFAPGAYVPAYVRRYPFMLAKLRPDTDEMSLCFDPTPGLLGAEEEGVALFADGQPTPEVKQTLEFCEQFEIAAQRTGAFMNELKELDLLMEGEVSIQPVGAAQPFIYRGFQMVSEEKVRELRGDQLRKINQSGLLPLVNAHLFSLGLISELFQAQYQAGLGPQAPAQA